MTSSNRTRVSSVTLEPGTCGSGTVKKGQSLRVTDVDGGQVADFVSFRQNDPSEHFDCLYTNLANGRWKWEEGATLFTNHLKRMWVIKDDKTGVHFTGGGFCSNDVRRFLDRSDTVKGCRDGLEATLSENGIAPHFLQATSCFNIFMNIVYKEDGTWPAMPPVTKPGDFIELRAEMDIFWALSVCVWTPVLAGAPSPLRIETFS